MFWLKSVSLLLMVVFGTWTTGCASLAYYQQAVAGQMELLSNRRSVEDVLVDDKVPASTRERIRTAQRMTRFAEEQIGLPVDGTFSSYVDIGRPFVVWNVFSAPEFSLDLETFCFPIAGCVSYKGFFDRSEAMQFAQDMKQKGYEVHVGGVEAYSTLGWFADPLLNTFIHRTDERLASLIFHELAHKLLYVSGDTVFNESFATAVERYCVKQWLVAEGRTADYAQYLAAVDRRNAVVALILDARAQLKSIYVKTTSEESKRIAKARVFAELRLLYSGLKLSWVEGNEFEYWMQDDINNAKLSAVGAYQDWVPAFLILLEQSGSFEKFVARVNEVADLDQQLRSEFLAKLLPGTRRTAE